MAGLSDYAASTNLQWATGLRPAPAVVSRFLALFTTAPTSDAGTGGTEVSTSGTAYARVQVAGQVATSASTTTASAVLTFASVPAWIVAGMSAYDVTAPTAIPTQTVLSTTGTTVTLSAVVSATVGSGDTIQFSAWPLATASSGTEPAVTPVQLTNGATIAYAAATASWGTVVAFGIYDAVTSGNLIAFDFLGNFKWLPFACTSASPGVLTSPAHGYANGDPVVVTAKFGGVLPTTGGSWAGALTVASASTDTFTAGVNTTGTGDGLVRKIVQQSIPSGVTASFASSTLTLTSA